MKWATGMLSELNNHSLRLSYIPWNGEKLDTYWLHNISSRLIKSIANSKSYVDPAEFMQSLPTTFALSHLVNTGSV